MKEEKENVQKDEIGEEGSYEAEIISVSWDVETQAHK